MHPVHANGACPHSWCRAHAHTRDDTTDVDQAERDAAARRVTLARARVDSVRRAFMRREAGASDVVAAEHQLGRKLDPGDGEVSQPATLPGDARDDDPPSPFVFA